MVFDPKKHVIRVQGNREYLPVSARLVWFRQEHPDWSIVTSPVEINLEKQYAIFSATIMNADGKVIATGTKMENIKGFGDYIEKAETGSVGRALAMCGFGTQFAPELEEGGGRYADSPIGPSAVGNRFAARPNGNGNGNGFGNRPGPTRPPMPTGGPNTGGPRDNAPRPPMPMTEDESPFEPAATPPVRERPAPIAANGNSPTRPTAAPSGQNATLSGAPPQSAPTPRPTPANNGNGGITRVREPEPDYTDPGGSDEPESDEELFVEDSYAPMPTAARPMPPQEAAIPAGPPKPNPLSGNNCSVSGCRNVLTPSQMTMSMQKFGKPLCLVHQRDSALTGVARTLAEL